MSSDDRLRQAFEDLEQRTRRVDPRTSLQRLPSSPPRPAWLPALAGAAAVVAVIGAVAVSGFLSGPAEEDTTGTTAATTETTPAVPSTSTTEFVTTTIAPVEGDPHLPTHRVSGVAADDVLNVRRDPGTDGELYVELAPDYAGIRLLSNVATVADGAEWWEIELLDPVRLIGLEEPLDGAPITGWVNSAFLTSYDPAHEDDVAPCTGEIGTPPGSTGPSPDHVYALRQFQLGPCVRTVVTFGQNFDDGRWPYDALTTDVRPAGSPAVRLERINGTTAVVLEGVPYAWATHSGTFESSVALVGRWIDGSLAIFVTVPGFTSVQVTDDGRMVIDVTPSAPSGPAGLGFHLLGAPVVTPGAIEVWGLARPFEATVGTSLFRDGAPLEGVGPPYVMATDYTDAWGLFRYRAAGLEAGDHVLAVSRQGGPEDVSSLDIPFSVPAHSPDAAVTEADLQLTDQLRSLARGEAGLPPVPFADTVTISLGVDHVAALLDPTTPGAWIIDVDEWNGYAGPFDVLGPLRAEAGMTVTLVGPQPHCAAPPLDAPWTSARRLSIQPTGVTSCLEWYAVDVFVDSSGAVTHVMLDLWEP
jgi:hypothetical protein